MQKSPKFRLKQVTSHPNLVIGKRNNTEPGHHEELKSIHQIGGDKKVRAGGKSAHLNA